VEKRAARVPDGVKKRRAKAPGCPQKIKTTIFFPCVFIGETRVSGKTFTSFWIKVLIFSWRGDNIRTSEANETTDATQTGTIKMTTATTRRAKAGGELGANGEWYEGGKFINTVKENAKRHGSRPKQASKQQIAPYQWEVGPAGSRSLYTQFAGAWGRVENGVAVFAYGSDTDRLDHVLAYCGRTKAEGQVMLDRWNSGERWL
jgi:hypothetical protein